MLTLSMSIPRPNKFVATRIRWNETKLKNQNQHFDTGIIRNYMNVDVWWTQTYCVLLHADWCLLRFRPYVSKTMKQESNTFVHFCCNYWIFKFTQKILIFKNINQISQTLHFGRMQSLSQTIRKLSPCKNCHQDRVEVLLQMHTGFW